MSSEASTSWPAPAKLNLCLHVTGRRSDGFHELETVFQFIDWCDRLTFQPRGDDRVSRSGWNGVAASHDLAVRAARLLREAAGVRRGVNIHLEKHLPAGGGLGGGSSDAATTLVALNHHWGTGLDEDALAGLGLRLGADVPVFVRGRAAVARGIGERLEPVSPAEPWFVVVDPGVAVSTAAVFQDPELTRNSAPTTIPGLLSGGGRNDCEAVVRRRYPAVARALDWLGRHGEARLTGTGGCLFAAFDTERAAREVARQVPDPWRGHVARGLNRSPLLERLAQADRGH